MSLAIILAHLASGDYDGNRIDNEQNGVSWGMYIDKGTPVKYREGKSRKIYNGKENVRIPGKRTEERYETEKEKESFFQKYGYLRSMFGNNPEVLDYSHDYYEKKKGGK